MIVNVIFLFCQILTGVLLFRSMFSWMSPGQTNFFTSGLFQLTEPILAPLRRILPKSGRLDLSPFVAIVILQVIILILPLFKV